MTAATTPQAAFNTAITWNAHDIGYLVRISGPSIKADTIDVSSHDSANGYREFVAGLRDGGEISLDVRYITGDTTGQSSFLTDLHAGTERQVIITFPDGANWTFDAIPTGFSPSADFDADMVVTLTMKVTGKPVFSSS